MINENEVNMLEYFDAVVRNTVESVVVISQNKIKNQICRRNQNNKIHLNTMLQDAKIQVLYFSLLPIAMFAEIWYNIFIYKLRLLAEDNNMFGNLDINATKAYKAKIQDSLLLNCDEFEKALSGRDDY